MTSSRRLLIVLATVSSALHHARGFDDPKGKVPHAPEAIRLPPTVEGALWWLPEDTQTIVVDQVPTKLREPDRANRAGSRSANPWYLRNLKKGDLAQQLEGRHVRLQIEGARRFRPCQALGMMPYEGATLLFLERELDAGISQALHEGAAKSEMLSSRRVSLFRESFEGFEWTIYVTHPRPDLLIFATDRGYISALLSRMHERGKTRALPETNPEWRLLDPASPWWAIRHYDTTDATLDPTSPLGDRDGWYIRDNGAVGLVFQVDPKGRIGSLKQLSKSEGALEQVNKFWRAPDLDRQMETKPNIRLVAPGVVEISSSLEGKDSAAMFYFILSAALGHGICL